MVDDNLEVPRRGTSEIHQNDRNPRTITTRKSTESHPG